MLFSLGRVPVQLLWSFANLLDGEAVWFFKLLNITFIAVLAHVIVNAIVSKLHKRWIEPHRAWQDTLILAFSRPIVFYIWIIASFQSINLATDYYLSDYFGSQLKTGLNLSVIALFCWFLLRWKRNVMQLLMMRSYAREISLSPGKLGGINKLSSIMIALLTILLMMDVTDQSLKTVVAFGGISSLAIAFASQETISNFFGGIMVHINQPFYEKDVIQIPASNIEGHVEGIGWYQTCIRNIDKKPIYVPNSLFTKSYVINHSRVSHRKIKEAFVLRYQDLSHIPAIIEDIEKMIANHSVVDKTEKLNVNLDGIGPYGVTISVLFYTSYFPEEEFLHFRDAILIECVHIIHRHEARLQFQLPSCISDREDRGKSQQGDLLESVHKK